MADSYQDKEDLVQEGRIAMWEALQNYDESKGSKPAWLTKHANWKMLTSVKFERLTGMPSRNHGRNARQREPLPVSPVSDPIFGEGTSECRDSVLESLSRDKVFLPESSDLKYHHRDFRRAVSSLTDSQKKFVYLKFVVGKTYSEMKEDFGYEPTGLWSSPKNGAKRKLRESLKHLEKVDA